MELTSKVAKTKESKNILDRVFKLTENNTTVKTEVLAGITTFMTMAYILVVNPLILGDAGMDRGAVFMATALSAALATFVMAFLANYPFALAPGMGLNAFFAYGVVLGMGYSWQFALTAVFIEGLIFILLTFFNVREKIINAIPTVLKNAVSAGIGLFIAFIGLVNINLIQQGGAIITLGHIQSPLIVLSLCGLLLTSVLFARKVKGAFLIGMILTSVAGMAIGLVPSPGKIIDIPPSISPIFMAFTDVPKSQIFSIDMLIVVFTLLFVDLFDTIGCLVGVASKADMLDSEGKLPKAKQALFADAIGTTAGAMFGTSTVTTFVESAAGIAEGGRTGLTAFTTGVLFLISTLFAPVFTSIPAEATAPVLILVGVMMASSMLKIDFNDLTEAIPAFLTIILMPLTYSIAEGLVFGIVSYASIKLLTGKGKVVEPSLYVLAILFIVKYAFAG
ncbi:putative MFS transporter, AGZA family, xanthine/uracil permease [Alkalithermobacter thermoalcaliphilus JW-YL-7 = DSM 7308]|uniref:MFS transporter, AGZA family, xanthine/uracil permease n=1 Tax=Alkalithermobacter thermoalcaliphilus JW-YL-7 = DSM 7308 TaxID=1121328 RepID=A0A150FNH9_CLOPD|nr:Xanthine/uracil/vitamin C permease [[Clostridium] paradoxum JW-YL-7 = DSM 7308]SHK90740.1 putative MFS transporter, AGZA family, xanthine/uracil permease [[Clostridium] paradoxum JW-YL-7 = DSM 7308]